jgi:hypothetical protein
MFIPDPNFFLPESWNQSKMIPDPGYVSAFFLKNVSILAQKIVSKLSEISSGLSIPDPDPGQKGAGSQIRIRNTAIYYYYY